MEKRLVKKELILKAVGGKTALERLWRRRLYKNKKENILILARLKDGTRITIDLCGTAIRYGLAGTADQIGNTIQRFC